MYQFLSLFFFMFFYFLFYTHYQLLLFLQRLIVFWN